MTNERARQSTLFLIAGSLFLFFAGVAITVFIPTTDPALRKATALGRAKRAAAPERDTPEARGRKIYIREGCWYCHTQQVRPIIADMGLGPVSQPGDYVYDEPHLLGTERTGPDLTHAGSRAPSNALAWNIEHHKNPKRFRPWSIMPPFDYLSKKELDDLASYIVSLK